MSDPDALIVGQGLAGSCMAWTLHWAGRQVMIVDRGEPITASREHPVLPEQLAGRWSLERALARQRAAASGAIQRACHVVDLRAPNVTIAGTDP